jgi:hypothetical protein
MGDREFIGDAWMAYLHEAKTPFILRLRENQHAVSFAMFFSCACDSIGCHQHNPAMAGGTAGCGEGRLRRPASDTKQCSGPRRSPVGFEVIQANVCQ